MKKGWFTLFLLLFSISIVNAKSDYSVSVGTKNLTKGGNTKLTIKGNNVTGRFNIKTSDASVISVSEGSIWIENNSYSITLKALNVGSATITVTPATGTSDSSGNAVSLASKSVKITVSLPREKSSNNNLKSLAIEGYDLSPAFDPNTLEYTTTVPATIDKITIQAQKADSYASITGSGEFEVSEGTNEFKVVVTSETKQEKVYKIVVNVEDLNPIEVTINGETYTVVKNAKNLQAPFSYTETTVQIDNNVVPGFFNENIKYQLVGLKDSSGNISLFTYNNGKYEKYNEIKGESITVTPLRLPELDLPKILKYSKDEVDFAGIKAEALVIGENRRFALIYGKNVETGEEDFYQYNFDDKTIQLYDFQGIEAMISYAKFIYIILGLSIVVTILFISTVVLVIFNIRKKKLIKKYINKKQSSLDKANNNENQDETSNDIFKDDNKKVSKKKNKK